MNSDMHWLTTALDGFVAFLPGLAAGLAVLLLGYIVGRVLARVTRTVLRRVGFDRLMARIGLGRLDVEEPRPPSYWSGTAVLVVIMIATLMQASRLWGLTFVAVGFARLLAYVPHVIAAAVIFAAAVLLANWARDRLVASSFMNAQVSSQDGRVIPFVARGIIIGMGSFMALRELQIAPEIVNLAFSLTLGAVALATALAFGLGGRDVAGRIAQSWYDRRNGNGHRVYRTPPPQVGPQMGSQARRG